MPQGQALEKRAPAQPCGKLRATLELGVRMDAPASQPKPHRGIYLLPNLLTTGAMFAGFYAIIAAIGGQYADAVIAVFVAALFDGLDGRVARLTNTQSEFGVQYDSLSDLVSFGVAPALVLYVWSLESLREHGAAWGKLGWAAAFIFAACGALRLARFNTQVGVADKRFFQGLAIPAGAGLVMSYVWTVLDLGLTGAQVQFITPVIAIVAGLLMVSRFRYYSFKSWPRSDKVPFFWLILFVLILVALAMNPPRVLFGIAVIYALSGPVLTVWGRARARSRHESRPSESKAP
jgi:CDP-diacylglycerol--serine O-phosphatidyltransferase